MVLRAPRPAPPRDHARLPIALLGLAVVVLVATGANPPAGRLAWSLEVAPGVLGGLVLVATYRRFPFSHLVYLGAFLHLLILVYGGYHTYAATPLGNWAREAFGFARNHYDRVGHFAQGFVPVLILRELYLRQTPLRSGGWLTLALLGMVLGLSALWELLEWWTTLLVASDVGTAFLGTQGDPWDAQWDMFLALVGAVVSLALMSRRHDRSMARIPRDG